MKHVLMAFRSANWILRSKYFTNIDKGPTIEPVAVDRNKVYHRKVRVHYVAAGLDLTFTACRMNNEDPGK